VEGTENPKVTGEQIDTDQIERSDNQQIETNTKQDIVNTVSDEKKDTVQIDSPDNQQIEPNTKQDSVNTENDETKNTQQTAQTKQIMPDKSTNTQTEIQNEQENERSKIASPNNRFRNAANKIIIQQKIVKELKPLKARYICPKILTDMGLTNKENKCKKKLLTYDSCMLEWQHHHVRDSAEQLLQANKKCKRSSKVGKRSM